MRQPQKTRFDLNVLPLVTTMVRQVTRQHLTHINDVYWIYDKSHTLLENGYTHLSFPKVGSPHMREAFANRENWVKGTQSLRGWVWQNIVLSATSILEVYITSACTVVFSACPELIDRSVLGTDSVTFIKYPNRRPSGWQRLIKQRAEAPTKGTWSERLKTLGREIGRVPQMVIDQTGELQRLQDKRNRIAHSYGAEGELRRTPWEPINAITIEDGDIPKIFKLVDDVSKSLDKSLFGPLIGGYEIFHEYDAWLRSHRTADTLPRRPLLNRSFRKHLGQAFGRSPGSTYVRDMIEYYDRV